MAEWLARGRGTAYLASGGLMVGDLEAIGDAMTGAVVGRAVEPRAGEAADGHSHEANCLNCGAALTGPYCRECGQRAHVHKTLTAFAHDLAHGVFHLEGKLWNTIPMLVWRPGELTRRYIDGQRARFVSPIALFLFCVFLMFAIIGMTTGKTINDGAKGREDIAHQVRNDRQKIQQLEQQRASLVKSGASTEDVDDQLDDLKAESSALQMGIGNSPDSKSDGTDFGDGTPKWVKKMALKARENPELLLFKMKTNAYKFSWALIPISVPFVWLLFPFSRRFKLYDHTVFVTYSLCFMMLLLSAATVVGLASNSVAGLLVFVPPFHMYRQLRGAYALGRWGAVWRTIALLIFALIAISVFAVLLVLLGVLE